MGKNVLRLGLCVLTAIVITLTVASVAQAAKGVVLGGVAEWPSLSPTLNRIFFLVRLDLEGPLEIAYLERDTDTSTWIKPPRVMVHRDDYPSGGEEPC